MKCSLLGTVMGLALVLAASARVLAVTEVHAPTEDPDYRDLRDGYVRTWYIFNDSLLDGVLNPGDTRITALDNWWTPLSAHTQHNYDALWVTDEHTYAGTDDRISLPMNHATNVFKDTPADPDNNANYNFWLDTTTFNENTVHFYMTYSQYDNNDFDNMPGATNEQQLTNARNRERNGWAMGWVTNKVNDPNNPVPADQVKVGQVEMDLFVHSGQGTFAMLDQTGNPLGSSISNPQVCLSNDISHKALENTQWQPPSFDGTTTGTYDENFLANQLYRNVLSISEADFQEIVDSMEIREWNSYDIQNQTTVVNPNRAPSEIKDHFTSGDLPAGYQYEYTDAFTDRSVYAHGTNDGGVIAGLSGYDNYNYYQTGENNWWDQQVIRIDISENMLKGGDDVDENGNPIYGNIQKLVFYDFGSLGTLTDSVGSLITDPQINPAKIIFGVDNTQTFLHGQIYFDHPTLGRVWFPENRIYIAQVEMVPEPGTMAILAVGALGVLLRRRKMKA